ncbi:MAG: hypothetical protein WAU88_04845 [Candidatus Zixiibacteriota bacterium]
MRREVPIAITAIVGIVYVIQYFIPHFPMSKMSDWFSDWFSIIAAAAIWMGILNLVKLSLQNIYQRKEDWWYSAIIVICIVLMAAVGFAAGQSYSGDVGSPTAFSWLYDNVYDPMSSTMYAMLAFFVASASYRAFRARNVEASLLLCAAFLVMLGRVPVGDVLTGFLPEKLQLSQVATWIMNFPNTAGQRAILMGISLGIVSTSLRIILGIERSHLGGGD